MRVDESMPRGEIQQFKAHRQDNPHNNYPRPGSPQFKAVPVSNDTEANPQKVLDDSNRDIRGHVVCIVPRPETEVADMRRIQEHADPAPETTQRRLIPRRVLIKTQYPDHSKVHPIHHVCAGPEVVQFLRQREIPRVKYRAEGPASQAAVAKRKIVWP